MKKALGILSKSRRMADFYAGLLNGLLGSMAEIDASSLEDGSIRTLRDCDLYLVSVTSYDLIYHSCPRRPGRFRPPSPSAWRQWKPSGPIPRAQRPCW